MAIVKGKARSAGRQLATYLLSMKENEMVRIIDLDGQMNFQDWELKTLLGDFTLNEKLTRGRKGIYHATIRPEQTVSMTMTDDEWMECVDILSDALKFSNQRKAVVMHEKQGWRHIHIAYERVDLEKRKMLSIDNDYAKQTKARKKIAQRFDMRQTPEINANRKKIKEELTALWRKTDDDKGFLRMAKQQGYTIARGFDKQEFVVIDKTGRSFELRRHLDKVRIKEVRERFASTKLMKEKEALALARTQLEVTLKNKPDNTISERQRIINKLEADRQDRKMKFNGPKMK